MTTQRSAQGLSAYLPVIVVGVLLLQAAFITSYVYGLHSPDKSDVPVDVVSSSQQEVGYYEEALGAAAHNVDLNPVSTVEEGQDNIRHGSSFGVYAPEKNKLYVASAAGPSATELVEKTIKALAQQMRQNPEVTDIAPLPDNNSRGLVGYYLVIGWLVGAYLLAAILGLYRGMSPATRSRGLLRVGVFAAYGVASGAVGTLIADTGFGYLQGNGWVVFAIGTLLVFAVGMFTTALECLAGLAGTGAAILLFVVLGNPSAGGPWPYVMQPDFYAAIGPYLPNGAATTAVQRATYFDGNALLMPLLIIAGYAVVGVLGTLALSGHRNRLVTLTEPN